jgi:hypothetical protein
VQVVEVPQRISLSKGLGSQRGVDDPRSNSFQKEGETGSMFKKGAANSQEAISSEMMSNWSKMQNEYINENEKEVPAHSSKVIHHVLHPFQDLI